MRSILFTLLVSIFLFQSCEPQKELYPGKKINSSLNIEKDTFLFAGATSADPTLRIEGRDLVIDFGGSVLVGSEDLSHPEDFQGIGIHVASGSNITIKNLSIHGFAVALFAEEVDSLHLVNCNFSYLRRQSVSEVRPTKVFPKEIAAKDSDWMTTISAGAGILLRNCNNARLHQLQIHHAQNGLLLDNCSEALIYNNTFQFNAGLGIGLYASNTNQILFNALDWNFAAETMEKEQGGVVFLGDCTTNTLAYNSITHSGSNQLFYKSSASRGALGSNHGNQILANDFSYAPGYGVLQTFEGGNLFSDNVLSGCEGEMIENNQSSTTIRQAYSKALQAALDSIIFPDNEKGMNPVLNAPIRKGCEYKILDDYGPYDFSYPQLVHRGIDEAGNFLFTIFGPPGNWEAKGGKGFRRMSLKRGTIPATLVMQTEKIGGRKSIELEYIGPAFTDAFGRDVEKGKSVLLKWQAE